jgi:hypothetical protein
MSDVDTSLLLYVGIPVAFSALLGILASWLYRKRARERGRLLEMSRRERLEHLHHGRPGSVTGSLPYDPRSSGVDSLTRRLSEIPDTTDNVSDDIEACIIPVNSNHNN